MTNDKTWREAVASPTSDRVVHFRYVSLSIGADFGILILTFFTSRAVGDLPFLKKG